MKTNVLSDPVKKVPEIFKTDPTEDKRHGHDHGMTV